MPTILHRLSIAASPGLVQELVATKEGIERWWTGRPVAGEDRAGGRLAVFFGEGAKPAAVLEVVAHAPKEVAWRCVEGPPDWLGTLITFAFRPRQDGGTTLLFRHEGWGEETEFMSGCSTNWAAYLMSLKAGAEGGGFNPYPGGEVSRWD